MSTDIVFIDYRIAQRIGDGYEFAEVVVGVGCAVAVGINGTGAATESVIFRARDVATSIDGCNLTTERIITGCVCDG